MTDAKTILENPAVKLICTFDENGNLVGVIDTEDPKRNTVVVPCDSVPLGGLVHGVTDPIKIHKIEPFQVIVYEKSPKKITVHMRGIFVPPIS